MTENNNSGNTKKTLTLKSGTLSLKKAIPSRNSKDSDSNGVVIVKKREAGYDGGNQSGKLTSEERGDAIFCTEDVWFKRWQRRWQEKCKIS